MRGKERYERDMASAIAKGKREGMEAGLREGEKQAFQLFQKLMQDALLRLFDLFGDEVPDDNKMNYSIYTETKNI